jgi:hypothetical protein
MLNDTHTDREELSREEIDRLADDIALAAANIDAATHRLLSCIRRFDGSGGWAWQGARSTAHWLSWRFALPPPPQAGPRRGLPRPARRRWRVGLPRAGRTTHRSVPQPPRVRSPDVVFTENVELGLHILPHTNLPRWDGSPLGRDGLGRCVSGPLGCSPLPLM